MVFRAAFALQGPDWVVATKAYVPQNLKYLVSGLLTEKVSEPCYTGSNL